jgi:hypothetical protein
LMTYPRGQSIKLVENWHVLCFGLEASDATVVQYGSSLGNGDPNEFAFEGI